MKLIATFCLPGILFSASAMAREWPFTVYLDNKEIGQHTFALEEHEGSAELKSRAKFNVKILFINAYSYLHSADEKWNGDCLNALEARTEEKKELRIVKGRLEDHGFVLEGLKGKQTLPACVMTFTYWNPKMLTQTKLLNPDTGDWLDVKIRMVGSEIIQVRGQSVKADQYQLDAPKLHIDLWYSTENGQVKDWLALKSTTPEGYVISYKLR